MKILFVINSLHLGGAEKFVVDLCNSLSKQQDLDISLLTISGQDSVIEDHVDQNYVKLIRLNHSSSYSFKSLPTLFRILSKNRFDIIHVHLFPAQLWMSLIKRFFKKIVLVTTEHSTINNRRRLKVLKLLDLLMYKQYDQVIAVSKETANSLVSWLPEIDKKITIIQNGINIKSIDQVSSYDKSFLLNNYSKEMRFIGMFARLEYPKDYLTVIKAISKMSNDFHFFVVGSGSMYDEIFSYIKLHKLETNVHLLGYRNDVIALMKTMDAIVLSSAYEGLSISALEAMASKKPLIATNVKGLRELVESVGMLFEYGNYVQLKQNFEELFNNHSLYTSLCEKSYKKAKLYDIEEIAIQHKNLYESIKKSEAL